MYKEELARLWYYVDQLLSAKHTYLIFLNDVKNRLEAELYTDFAEPEKEVVISDEDEVRVSVRIFIFEHFCVAFEITYFWALFKGVDDKISDAAQILNAHIQTQGGQLPQKVS